MLDLKELGFCSHFILSRLKDRFAFKSRLQDLKIEMQEKETVALVTNFNLRDLFKTQVINIKMVYCEAVNFCIPEFRRQKEEKV